LVLDKPDLPNAPNNSHFGIVQESSDGRKLQEALYCDGFQMTNKMVSTQAFGFLFWAGRSGYQDPIEPFERVDFPIGGQGRLAVKSQFSWNSPCGEVKLNPTMEIHLGHNYHSHSSIVSCDAFPSTERLERFRVQFWCYLLEPESDDESYSSCDSCAAVNGREFQLVEGLGRCCDVGSTGLGELRRRAGTCGNPKPCNLLY
jgi:hypothetical protein